MVKNLPANAGDTVNTGSILSWEDLLEEEMATHSSILFFFLSTPVFLLGKVPQREEPGGLQSMESQRVGRN